MNWLDPWYSIADNPDQANGMARELQRELAAGHALFGVPVEAVGRRCDSDDVVFHLLDGSDRFAAVHLTWIQSPPERPPFPWTTMYESCDQWIAECMIADHKEYTKLESGNRLLLDLSRLRRLH